MSGGSQVHIFWGAPAGPLKMTVSQETTSLMSAVDTWGKIQLLYDQHSLHLKDENCQPRNVKSCQAPEATGPPDLNGHFLANSVNQSAQVKEDFLYSTLVTQNLKPLKIHPPGLSEANISNVQICDSKDKIQHLPEEETHHKLHCEMKKITDEQPKNESNICGQNFQTNSFQLDHEHAVILDLACSTEQPNTGLEAIGKKCMPTVHHEMQDQCLEVFSPITVGEPRSEGAVRKVSNPIISTDTEFLSIMTSSQLAFLTQRKNKVQSSVDNGTLNMEIGPKASLGEIQRTEDILIWPDDNFAEGYESRQNQAHSLELLSPVCPATKSNSIQINPEKDLEENTESQELFSSEDELPPNEICIELCSSGILCSQLTTFHKIAVKRSLTSRDKSVHSKALSEVPQVAKKMKLGSNARDFAVAVDQRTVSGFKGIKKISLIKNCDSKSQKYNCLVMVLTPCHVKEINIKSGPNFGSKVPLATITVIDQSEIKKKVFLWRTTAFWALTVFLGDIILLTDVTIHEDQWIGETVLQSTFTSQLLNLGSYSSLQPKEYSSIVSNVALEDLLAYLSSKHSYLKDLPLRQPQRVDSIEFVELEQLQPDRLVHAVLRVVDIITLTEALYNYRGQKQRKVILTVEQAQSQHCVLVLWGPGVAWCPQLQRKKGYIWEFRYLFVQRNCILETLELHTTPWSSCECLFDDDIRAIKFKTKFQKLTPSFVKMSDLATHLKNKYSGDILIKAQILELVFRVGTAQTVSLNTHSSLKSIFSSLPNFIYTGCAQCGLELEMDENKIYKQCLSCLPLTKKKTHYRSALMTVADGRHNICIHVGSKLIEKILLNISPDCLNRVIVPSSDLTYGMVAADLLHSLLAVSAEPPVLKIQSLFMLEDNSYPLQQDFSLLDFCPDPFKAWNPLLRPEKDAASIP